MNLCVLILINIFYRLGYPYYTYIHVLVLEHSPKEFLKINIIGCGYIMMRQYYKHLFMKKNHLGENIVRNGCKGVLSFQRND